MTQFNSKWIWISRKQGYVYCFSLYCGKIHQICEYDIFQLKIWIRTKNNLFATLFALRKEKCKFEVTEVLWLGHDQHGMSMDHAMVQFIKEWVRKNHSSRWLSFVKLLWDPARTGPTQTLHCPTRNSQPSLSALGGQTVGGCFLKTQGQMTSHYDPNRDTSLYVHKGPNWVSGQWHRGITWKGLMIRCGIKLLTQTSQNCSRD